MYVIKLTANNRRSGGQWSTAFCVGGPMGCTETGEFQDDYSEIGCEVQFYRNVRILFCFVALNTS